MSQQIICDGCSKPIPHGESQAQVEILRTVGGREVRHYHDSATKPSCASRAGITTFEEAADGGE